MNSSDREPLIRLEGVTKVFLTDEMETHALDDVSILVKEGITRYRRFETMISESTAAMVVPVIIRPVPIAPMIFSSTAPFRFRTLMERRMSVSTE